MDYQPLRNWPHDVSPFHAGSLAIQHAYGVAEKMDAQGRRGITAVLMEQHRAFFSHLPFVVAGARDAAGQPWATLLFGQPGFMNSPAPEILRIAAMPQAGDPLHAAFVPGAQMGLLGIEPATRRRNRTNGVIASADALGFELAVEQAFGNCPKYIQSRSHRVAVPGPSHQTRSAQLDEAARKLIMLADTFFIATAYQADDAAPAGGADVSHRGGNPGFVRVDQDGHLTVPDFTGNFHFRTLGNILSDPRAGLLFPDFLTGDLLYLAVTATVIWNGPEVNAFPGAQRLLRFHVKEMIRLDAAMPLRFDDGERSPFLAATGTW